MQVVHLPVEAAHCEHPKAYAVDSQQRLPMQEALLQPAFEVQEPPGSLFAAAAAAFPSGDAAYAQAFPSGVAYALSQPVLHCRDRGQTETDVKGVRA